LDWALLDTLLVAELDALLDLPLGFASRPIMPPLPYLLFHRLPGPGDCIRPKYLASEIFLPFAISISHITNSRLIPWNLAGAWENHNAKLNTVIILRSPVAAT